jgi:hypothetical protein
VARGAWAAALVGAAVVVGCTHPTPRTTASTPGSTPTVAETVQRTIAWRGSPATVNSRPETGYTLPAPAGPSPPCRLSGLTIVPMGGGAGGTFYAHVSVHNTSSAVCSLRGRPEIALIDKAGRIFQSTGPDPQHRPIRTVVLVPNSWALVDLGGIASDVCGGDQTTTLRISLPGQTASRSMRFPVGAPPDPTDCSGRVVGATPHPGQLQVGPFQAIAKAQDDFLLIRQLQPHLRVPASVRAGSTLRFAVDFVNANAYEGGIDTDPCPIFRMQVTPTAVGGIYLLPCTPTISIDAGQSVAFEMELAVPVTAPLGPATLKWQLLEPDEPALTTTINIDA